MITFKATSVDDVELINTLAGDVFYSTYSSILSSEQIDYMFDMMYSLESLRNQLETKVYQYFIAYKDGEACGYFSILKLGEGAYHLDKAYILLSFQKMGVGRELINFIISHLRKTSSVKKIHLTLNVNRSNQAIGFFKNMGFEVIRSGDFDIGNGYFTNDYIMQFVIE